MKPLCISMMFLIGTGSIVHAQSGRSNLPSYAMKSGETIDITDLSYIINCKSLMTGLPEVQILEGPPGVTVSVVDTMVTSRVQQCPRAVKGAKLKLKADNIDDQSTSEMTLKIIFKTKDGDKLRDFKFVLDLFPAS